MSRIVPKCNLMSRPKVCYDTLAENGEALSEMPGPLLMPCSRPRHRKPASFGEALRGKRRGLSLWEKTGLPGSGRTGKGGEGNEKPCEIPMPGTAGIRRNPAPRTAIAAQNR